MNRRPREKLNFESPLKVFFQKVANFAVAGESRPVESRLGQLTF